MSYDSSKMQAPITKVYTIKRAHAHSLYTIRMNDSQSVIAFRNKSAAASFITLQNSIKHQDMTIDNTKLHILWRRCTQNALQLVLFNDKAEYEILDKFPLSIDDIQFYLDNNARFYSE